MKRRILTALVLLALILGPVLAAAPKANAVVLAGNSTVYVEKCGEAGLQSRLYPAFNSTGDLTLYLPGQADAGKLFLSWPQGTTVTLDGEPQISGQTPIPLPGQEASYEVDGRHILLRTVQGSAGVRAMFLEVDTRQEGYYSFAEISRDESKNMKSAGTMALGEETGCFFTLKGRGNSSWTAYDKKSYNITLYEDDSYAKKQAVSLIDGVSAKAWSLLANYSDGSLLRNKLGYDMANALGIGLSSDFVDLYVDGVYQGCYLLTPKNDYAAPEEGLVLELDNYLDDDPQFTLEGLKEYHATRYGFQNRFTVKENNTGATTGEIQTYLQAAWDAIRQENSEEYLQYIDLDSWAKYYLLHEFYKSFDVVCGSILMHRDGLTEDHKLIAGPIWDLDNALGRSNNNVDLGLTAEQQHSPEGWYIQNVCDPEAWPEGEVVTEFWLQELGKHDSFLERVYEIYRENRDLFDGAAARVRENIAKLSATANMNEDLYGIYKGVAFLKEADSHGCVATRSWQDYAENLANYAEKRADFLRNNIGNTQLLTQEAAPEARLPVIIAAVAVLCVCAAAAGLLLWKKRRSKR